MNEIPLSTEQEITVENNGLRLRGSLCRPAGQDARISVLLVPGSGELDRNQNGANLQLNIFNDIANKLASMGISSLRFDKRGCGDSDGEYNITGHGELVEDSSAWFNKLIELDAGKHNNHVIAGHSEGALIAAEVARNQAGASGQILLCPFIDKFDVVVERQIKRTISDLKAIPGLKGALVKLYLLFSGDQITRQRKVMASIRRSSKPTMKVRKQVLNANWIRDMLAIEPREIYAGMTTPTLLIGGGKDVQCPAADVSTIASLITARSEAEILGDLNHILRADVDSSGTQNYRQLSELPVDQRLIDSMANWMLEKFTEV